MQPLGRVAQLVQSTWFTSKGSGVRIPSRPQSSVTFLRFNTLKAQQVLLDCALLFKTTGLQGQEVTFAGAVGEGKSIPSRPQ